MPLQNRTAVAIAVVMAVIGKAQLSRAQLANIHTVVPVECTHGYFEWQVIGLAYSLKRVGQPGPLTRLMSCSEEQLKDYKWLDLMPTYVAPNLAHDTVHDDWYQPYNKPTAVHYWLRDVKPKEEFIMVIDADSILRMPFYPEHFNVTRGWAYSPYYMELLDGVQNALALKHVPDVAPRKDWFAGPEGRRADKVGPPYLMHREDMEKVAPLWYNFTYAVRNDPQAWNLTGDTSIKEPGGKTWISEMYGFCFAAAAAGVWHRQIDYTANLVPGNGPIGPPMVLHYGNDLSVNNTSYNFSKIAVREAGFDATLCPPWDLTPKPGFQVAAGGLLPYPPSPLSLPSQGLDLLRDLLSVESAIILNAAFCEHHKKHCSPSQQLEEECAKVAQQERELDQAYDAVEKELRATECKDSTLDCTGWTAEGMCYKNPRYMHFGCRKSCGTCFQPDLQVRWHGKQEAMQGSLDCAQLKARQAALVDYDLDYDHGLFGDIPDPCSEEATDDMADTGTDDAPAVADMAAEVAATEPPAESKRAAEAPVTEAAEAAAKTGPSGSAAAGGLSVKARVAEAMAARGATTGGAQQAVGDNASIAGEGGGVLGKVDRDSGFRGGQGEAAAGEEPRQPLSKRMRIGIRGRSGDAHARSAASIKLLVQILDWVGVVSIWCCVVALFLMFLRRPWGKPLLASQRSLSRPLIH